MMTRRIRDRRRRHLQDGRRRQGNRTLGHLAARWRPEKLGTVDRAEHSARQPEQNVLSGRICYERYTRSREPSMTDKHAIQDVLSQYVRATDERDGDAQAKLFADNGMIRFFGRSGTEKYQLAGEPVIGAERIRRHMEGFPPRPERTYQ